jgi:hypothetical protein
MFFKCLLSALSSSSSSSFTTQRFRRLSLVCSLVVNPSGYQRRSLHCRLLFSSRFLRYITRALCCVCFAVSSFVFVDLRRSFRCHALCDIYRIARVATARGLLRCSMWAFFVFALSSVALHSFNSSLRILSSLLTLILNHSITHHRYPPSSTLIFSFRYSLFIHQSLIFVFLPQHTAISPAKLAAKHNTLHSTKRTTLHHPELPTFVTALDSTLSSTFGITNHATE